MAPPTAVLQSQAGKRSYFELKKVRAFNPDDLALKKGCLVAVAGLQSSVANLANPVNFGR